MYAAQAIPPIDAEIAKKGHLWMDTSLCASGNVSASEGGAEAEQPIHRGTCAAGGVVTIGKCDRPQSPDINLLRMRQASNQKVTAFMTGEFPSVACKIGGGPN